MNKLNDIDCTGYALRNNTLIFTLTNTTMSNVASLDGQILNYQTNTGDILGQFRGYELISTSKEGNDIQALFMRKLDEATKSSIEALEVNLANLQKTARTSIIYLSSLTDSIPSLIMRANLTNKEAATYISVYPEWQVGFDYKKDWIIRYGEDLYRIGQDHTSQEQWIPGADGTTALYSKIEITEGGYEVWQEWDGVSGSYANGQIVQDPTDEKLYKSLIDNNVWGPPSEQPNYWELYEV